MQLPPAAAGVALALLVCVVLVGTPWTGRVELVSSAAAASFPGAQWKSWQGKVDTQIEAAERVSVGLTGSKAAQLNTLLSHDLAKDVLEEPKMAGSNVAVKKVAVKKVLPHRAAIAKSTQRVMAQAFGKPLASAIARDDAMIASAKKGVHEAEKQLIDESLSARKQNVNRPAVHPTTGEVAKVQAELRRKEAALIKKAKMSAHTVAKVLKSKAPSMSVMPAKTEKEASSASALAAQEQRVLSTMQQVLRATLMNGSQKVDSEVNKEEKHIGSELDKWGLP